LAKKIKKGIGIRKNWLQSILDNIETHSTISLSNNKFINLSFALTGTLNRPRKEIEDQIISLGGQISTSVSNNTNYLVTNETKSNSSKFLKAQKFGTKIISEIEFESLAVIS
jgi:DNA ligase (NAD+)